MSANQEAPQPSGANPLMHFEGQSYEQPPSNHAFEVTVDEDISLDELAEKTAQASVLRSAHVGNQYSSNVAVFEHGLPTVLYDRTIAPSNGPGTDRNYRPEVLMQARDSHPLLEREAHPYRMATHLEIEQMPENLDERVRQQAGKYAVDLHLNSLREGFPRTPSETHSQYLRRHQAVTAEMLDILGEDDDFLNSLNRQVSPQGTVSKLPEHADPARCVENIGWFGIDSPESGVVIPNQFNVLQYGVVEALETQAADVYHLSGPDMIKYAQQQELQDTLQQFYARIKQQASFADLLPETLRFHVVPTAHFKFVVPGSRQPELDELMQVCAWMEHSRQRLQQTRDSQEKTELKSDLEHMHQQRDRLLENLSELFTDVTDQNRLSHYDSTALGGEGVYIHPDMGSMSARQAAQLYKELHKRYKKITKDS
ncbi:hypothetical protein BRC21_01145 [Candidatus Saccharibacteria bacterium SW_7_54_9]|nr:MAG: hypothetical protein BRC21_01145 [Candidatus Saccharibacteria bacterium SW_7_54_9]